MDDVRSQFAGRTGARADVSTATLLGQVMFLVAVAIGFMALGSYIGRDLSLGTSRIIFFAGFGMLIVAAFVPRLRVGPIGIAWLYTIALMIGLGLGPVIAYFVANEPATITQAAGGTALTVLAMGSLGFALSKDLQAWMKPLSIAVFACAIIGIGLMLFSSTISPILSIAIYGLSAALIAVDFNYLRKHGTADDAVWLATGIFVSIVNIFLSLLNLLGE
jgi:modulator of FtsH protease